VQKPNKIPLFAHIRFGFLQNYLFFSLLKKKEKTLFDSLKEV